MILEVLSALDPSRSRVVGEVLSQLILDVVVVGQRLHQLLLLIELFQVVAVEELDMAIGSRFVSSRSISEEVQVRWLFAVARELGSILVQAILQLTVEGNSF